MICQSPDCQCKFSDDLDSCPLCGHDVDKPERTMVQQWNSTLKADPSKRPRQTYRINHRSKKRPNMAEFMRDFVKEIYPGYSGESVRCWNCGKRIKTLKYENISHRDPKSTHPEKALDVENLDILCGPTDYFGELDNSCHTLWERNRYEDFHQKRKKKKDKK